jgi:hypothetical protein
MSERPHDAALTEFERALAALEPAPPALDRDRLLFEAGRRSARRRGWPWPAAAAALGLLAAGLGGTLLLRPAPPVVVRVVREHTVSPVHAPDGDSEDGPAPVGRPGYFQLREQLLTRGLESLPTPAPAPAEPPAPLENFLDEPGLSGPRRDHPGL